jgi:hydroxyacylglutathione hydrolase
LEKTINPFFRTNSPDVITYAMKHGATSTDPLAVFAILRAEKNLF